MDDTTNTDTGTEAGETQQQEQVEQNAGQADTDDVKDEMQTSSGDDVNALRNDIPAGGSLEFVLADARQDDTDPKVYALIAEAPAEVAHHGDNFTIQTDGWTPEKGDTVRGERQVEGVEPVQLFAHLVSKHA